MSQYEFTADENRLISQVGTKLGHIAVLFLLLGGVQLLQSFMLTGAWGRWISLGAALLLFVLGWLFFRPLDNLRRIVTTTGQDAHEIVEAIRELRTAYLVAEVIMMVLAAGTIVEIMRLTTGTGF
jgi:hypothetical protein